MDFEIVPAEAVIGARVYGCSPANPPVGDALLALEDALETYGVLIFPDQQTVTPDQQIAFSRTLGLLEISDMESALLPGHPEIFVVGNTGEQPVTFSPSDDDGELEWQADHIHLSTPAQASLLLAKTVPSNGGDTLFACMYSAYETLQPGQKALYDQLEVINDTAGLDRYLDAQGHGVERTKLELNDPVVWPLVRAHPKTGRKALYFGNQISVGIVGWDEDDALSFIAELTQHACHPRFQYRHKWSEGDAVLWDNRRVLHAGTPYDLKNESREMHRTTIRETQPVRLLNRGC